MLSVKINVVDWIPWVIKNNAEVFNQSCFEKKCESERKVSTNV